MAEQKVLIVTGGSRGIGAATAILAARAGYAVGVNYLGNVQAANQVAQQIRQEGGQALAIQADVSQEAEVQTLFDTATEAFGPLTALVNNAGILETQARVEDIDAARLQRILSANVVGHFYVLRQRCAVCLPGTAGRAAAS